MKFITQNQPIEQAKQSEKVKLNSICTILTELVNDLVSKCNESIPKLLREDKELPEYKTNINFDDCLQFINKYSSKPVRAQPIKEYINTEKSKYYAQTLYPWLFRGVRSFIDIVSTTIEPNDKTLKYLLKQWITCNVFKELLQSLTESQVGAGLRPIICDGAFNNNGKKISEFVKCLTKIQFELALETTHTLKEYEAFVQNIKSKELRKKFFITKYREFETFARTEYINKRIEILMKEIHDTNDKHNYNNNNNNNNDNNNNNYCNKGDTYSYTFDSNNNNNNENNLSDDCKDNSASNNESNTDEYNNHYNIFDHHYTEMPDFNNLFDNDNISFGPFEHGMNEISSQIYNNNNTDYVDTNLDFDITMSDRLSPLSQNNGNIDIGSGSINYNDSNNWMVQHYNDITSSNNSNNNTYDNDMYINFDERYSNIPNLDGYLLHDY